PLDSDQSIGDAQLKVFNLADGSIHTIAHFQGNRGSFSMYAWGDPKHVAFVSYQRLPATTAATAATTPAASTTGVTAGMSDSARPLITGVSHIAVYAADPAKSESFYVHD